MVKNCPCRFYGLHGLFLFGDLLNGGQGIVGNEIGGIPCPCGTEFVQTGVSAAGQDKDAFTSGIVGEDDFIFSHIADNITFREVEMVAFGTLMNHTGTRLFTVAVVLGRMGTTVDGIDVWVECAENVGFGEVVCLAGQLTFTDFALIGEDQVEIACVMDSFQSFSGEGIGFEEFDAPGCVSAECAL